jgi:hypothetical protein
LPKLLRTEPETGKPQHPTLRNSGLKVTRRLGQMHC